MFKTNFSGHNRVGVHKNNNFGEALPLIAPPWLRACLDIEKKATFGQKKLTLNKTNK